MITAAHIVEALLDNEDFDPKDYALQTDPQWVWYNIVFMQGEDADEAFRIMDDQGESAALEHLKQWDYGHENEHTPETEPPSNDYDSLSQECVGGEYIMSWNRSVGYIGLTRSKKYLYGLPHGK